MNIDEKVENKRFTVYDSEANTVLELINELGSLTNDVCDSLDNKTDLYGDHKGSWQGLNRPTMSEEGMRATVEDIMDNKIPSIQSSLDNIVGELEKKEIFVDVVSGQDITEKLNNILMDAPMFSKIIIPFGTFYVNQIIIPPNKAGLEICGVGRSLTKIECSNPSVLVSLQSEYITFRDIAIRGKIGNLNITCFSDDRPEGRDDFDLRLYNCDFQIIQTLIKAKGHSVIIENCLFANWLQDGSIIDSVYSYPLENVDGHRTYIVNNNRFHYINSCIMKNKGSLSTSIDGVQITNNYIEGPLKYYEGYGKN